MPRIVATGLRSRGVNILDASSVTSAIQASSAGAAAGGGAEGLHATTTDELSSLAQKGGNDVARASTQGASGVSQGHGHLKVYDLNITEYVA